jgi:hypothetical protein
MQFSIKIQEQLYSLANYFIKYNIVEQRERSFIENENINKNIISLQNLNIEKTR